MTAPAPIETLRARLRPLLDEHAPADALAYYYAFHHAPERREVFVHSDEADPNRVDGFLIRARTGFDLFRPLMTFRALDQAAACALFREGLMAGRPVYFTVPEALAGWVNKYLSVSEAEIHRLYRFKAPVYHPQINVLLVTGTGPDGTPRCEIRSGDATRAVAGVNWQSPNFVEIFVYTEPAVRGRGWGKTVVATLADLLRQSGRTPLYVVAESNEYSIRLAEAAGFEDTRVREYVGEAVRRDEG